MAALRARFAESSPRLEVTSDEVLVFGDWAVQRGSIVVTADAAPRHLRYVEVLRRDDDGRWRVHWRIDAPV